MALPMNRVIEINLKAVNAITDYHDEMKQALAKGDFMRVGELRTSVTWVQKIVAMANKPYAEMLRGRIPDEILRSLGILGDESKESPNSGRYPWQELNLNDILRGLGINDDGDS